MSRLAAQFEVAKMRGWLLGHGELAGQRRVVRGSQIGASFQGLVRAARATPDMTGTLMLAYGINRLFSRSYR